MAEERDVKRRVKMRQPKLCWPKEKDRNEAGEQGGKKEMSEITPRDKSPEKSPNGIWIQGGREEENKR